MAQVDAIFAGTITQSIAGTALQKLSPDATFLSVVLNVTAMSGSGASAAFRIQWSVKAMYWRAVCDLAGTDPSFTGSANCYS